ncbi:MAG: LPS assembly lipoprotein LptE [Gammaproteobacteria bacterium]|nr:LPS assembly lipoprotein LptE [Gammaproteobacteria bacterium]
MVRNAVAIPIMMSALHRQRLHVALGFVLLGAANLGGCGFHLEGAGTLPAVTTTTYLDAANPHTEFYSSLREALTARGARVTESRQDAGAVLSILEDISGQRMLSVSVRNIPREYEVFYSITFSLESEGEKLIPAESLVATRSYTYDETLVLGKSAEEAVLRQSLAQDLVRRVLRRIEADKGPVAAVQ